MSAAARRWWRWTMAPRSQPSARPSRGVIRRPAGGKPTLVADLERQQRLDDRRDLVGELRGGERGDLAADERCRLRDLAEQRPQPAVTQPARRLERRGQDRRVEHVEV